MEEMNMANLANFAIKYTVVPEGENVDLNALAEDTLYDHCDDLVSALVDQGGIDQGNGLFAFYSGRGEEDVLQKIIRVRVYGHGAVTLD
jgi:hypothetical protein